MIRLLIIADDFTGALDTGVQLVTHGAKVRVITNPMADLKTFADETEVLVVDAETRHLSAEDAYKVIKQITECAVAMQIPHLYKKTDSALRGNIGAELMAFMDAAGEKKLAFIPAFPEIGRCTVNGVQYIGDIPVAESVFGQDPFEPVKHSEVADIIHEQSKVHTHYASVDKTTMKENGIYVFDASSQEELETIGEKLLTNDKLHITAGCAGFGTVLPKLLGWQQREQMVLPALDKKLLVVCGSVNPITLEQLGLAEEKGFYRYRITLEQKLHGSDWGRGGNAELIKELKQRLAQHPYMIIDSNDADGNESTRQYATVHEMSIEDVRVNISSTIGQIVSNLFDSPNLGTLLITGGDVLKQCMDWMEVYEMEPIGEMVPGIVLSRFTKEDCSRYVISKSGGFGEKTLINDLVKIMEHYNSMELRGEERWNTQNCLG